MNLLHDHPSRRQLLRTLGGCAVPWLTGLGWAGQIVQAADLPLATTGLEHFGMTVPDPEATARFYGRIFDPQLFQEREPPPRFYVKIGTGYLAFGGNANVPPSVDHVCALVQGYQPEEMRKSLADVGVPMGQGPLGMATDPDGFRLQLLATPGGLARTVIPAVRISQDDALLQAIGPDHLMLHVSNLEQSAEHYRKFFGEELSRTRKPARLWFGVARTRLGLEQVGRGEKPSVHHICVRVAGFNRRSAANTLKRAGVEIRPSDNENLLRFRDPNGFTMEIKGPR